MPRALFGAQGSQRIDAGRARGRQRAGCQRNPKPTHGKKIAHRIQWLDAVQRRRQRATHQNRQGNTHHYPGRRRAADCLSGSSRLPARAARLPPCALRSPLYARSPGTPAFHRVPSPPAPPPESRRTRRAEQTSPGWKSNRSYCARWVIGRINGRFGSICCTALRADGRIARARRERAFLRASRPSLESERTYTRPWEWALHSMLRYLWSLTTPTRSSGSAHSRFHQMAQRILIGQEIVAQIVR